MTDRHVHDLIVVGAGPAGSSVAYHAAASGLDVALLDRQEFPRDKVCGDRILPHAASEMRRIGLGDWLDRNATRGRHGVFEAIKLHAQSVAVHDSLPANVGPGYVVRRTETDAALVEKARATGVALETGVTARKPLRSSSGQLVGVEATSNGDQIRYGAPLVVVADGVGGFASKLKSPPDVVGIRQRFRMARTPAESDSAHYFVSADLFGRGAGVGYVFFYGNGLAVVGCGVMSRGPFHSRLPITEVHRRLLTTDHVRTWLDGAEPEDEPRTWPYRAGMQGPRHAQGLMLVGDAAGMAHPLTGEGVGFALESGRVAARWAENAHQSRDFSARRLSGYARELRRRRATMHYPAFALLRLLPTMALLEPAYRACAVNTEARKTLIRVAADETSMLTLLSHPQMLARAARELLN